MTLFVTLLLAVITVWYVVPAFLIAMNRSREDAARGRIVQLLGLFAPAMGEARRDPRALLVWQPLARAARGLMPEEFAALDREFGAAFPFSNDVIQSAHAQWSADWLAWEKSHDAEFKRRAAELEHELAASGGSAIVRAKLDAVEREKLELYQRRYEDYVRTAKALQSLTQ